MTITERGHDGPRSRPRQPAGPQVELIGLQILALISLRPFPLTGTVSLSRLKNQQTNNNDVNNKQHRGSSEKHGGVQEEEAVPSRDGLRWVVLTSVLPQHPIAVRVDEPGASRSFTKLHKASAQQQRGLEPGAGLAGEGQSRALCLHALTAQQRDSGGGARSGDVPTVSLSSPSR